MNYDPYNSVGRQYDIDVFCKALSEMHNALIEPMWKAIHRSVSQEMDEGYDPYNNTGRVRFHAKYADGSYLFSVTP